MTRAEIEERTRLLAQAFQQKATTTRDARFPALAGDALIVEASFGPKYARLVRYENSQGSACGFVDLATGDILYPKGWAGPVKGSPRGNVGAEDYGLSAFGDYAVRTLR